MYNVRQDKFLMEAFREISLDLPTSDRVRYLDVACEAVSNPDTAGAIINKLVKQITEGDSIDYGKIRESKGDVTRYTYYTPMAQCIGILENLSDAEKIPSIILMSKIHKILLGYRDDFTFGYKRKIDIIIQMYCVLVLQLYTLIDLSIADFTDYARTSNNVDASPVKASKKVLKFTSYVNSTIRLFESGNWSTIMRKIQKQSMQQTMAVIDAAANESLNTATDLFTDVGKQVAGNVAVVGRDIWQHIPNPIKIGGAVLAGLISMLYLLRWFTYFFSKKTMTFAMWARNQAELIRAAMAAEKEPKGVAAQEKFIKLLEGTADLIEYKILKTEKLTNEEIKTLNRSTLTPTELTSINGLVFD